MPSNRSARKVAVSCEGLRVSIAPEELTGCHVFEVGTRESIPFVTFGSGPTTRRQVRLIIESRYELIGVREPQIPPLEAIMCLIVETAAVESGWLELRFNLGVGLRVSPRQEVWTGDHARWLTDWYTTPFW